MFAVKEVLLRENCCVQVNSVLKSLLSTFAHITYKGALSRGFCCVQVNSVLFHCLVPLLISHIKRHCHGDFAVFRSILC